MRRHTYAVGLEAEGALLQDRASVVEAGAVLFIAVADGAGGLAGSEQAAEAVVRGLAILSQGEASPPDESAWVVWLSELDATIHQAGSWGETTAVILAVTDHAVFGASVGDSEVWLATVDGFRSLTDGQRRRPFLGTGLARPTPFRLDQPAGVLVVGTDGLFKYAPAWRICQVAIEQLPKVAAQSLIDLVRLPNGRLQDDIGVVVCDLG